MTIKAIKFGPFPHEMINRTLGTDLLPGNAYFSIVAQKHVIKKHPADYRIILPRLRDVVLSPTWIGQAPHHATSIELIRRLAIVDHVEKAIIDRHIALIAVSMEPDRYGDYRIASAYLIDQTDIDIRIAARRLFIPKK